MNVYIYFSCLGESEAVARRCSVKKNVFLENSKNSQVKTCAIVSFLGLQLY